MMLDVVVNKRGFMELPNIQQRYIRRYALAVVLATRLSSAANDQFRLPGESDVEHRFCGWISGGFKEHWPAAIKNRLRRLNRRANKYRCRASFMRPRYQRRETLFKLCSDAVKQARIDVNVHDSYYLAA